MYFFPAQVNNGNNPSAEQFCTFALGNEGDKTPDKVSTTSALIYFLTQPQRPTSEIECPEHRSPTERIQFPNKEVEVRPPAEVQRIKPSLNSHRALSERLEIPAGEEKGKKQRKNKDRSHFGKRSATCPSGSGTSLKKPDAEILKKNITFFVVFFK